MIPTHRMPSHPGEILALEFLEPNDLSQADLARKLEIPLQRVNELVNGKRGMTPETAVLLAGFFKTSEEFWMNLQTNFDLAKTRKKMEANHTLERLAKTW